MLLQSKHREHRRHKIYGKEKAEIAGLVERYGRVQSLMKYVNSDTLKESYSKQPKGKAVGVDGITKEQYGENLEENIESLLVRMKKFSYKPYPVRRAYIPKVMARCEDSAFRHLRIKSFKVSLKRYWKRFTSLSLRSFHLGFVQTEVVTMQFKE